jgi:hypothetical protein
MPVTQTFLNSINEVSFNNADEIDNWFLQRSGTDFVNWFNGHVANRLFWGKVGSRAGISIANDSQTHHRFSQLWSGQTINAMFDVGKISLLQFITLQSIINNETGGRLLPLTENVGRTGHPGIAYAFDKIPGIKRSYNTLPGNKTCFQLFNDMNYNQAFDILPLASQLKNTSNNVWAGEAYPQRISTSTNPMQTGYVLEADFFKFRGRGFIQTTGRSNYKKLVEFIMAYTGSSNTIIKIKEKWLSVSADKDVVATISTNTDWDSLFQKGDSLIAGRAISLHNNACGNYLKKITTSNPNAAMDSIFNMGKCISGSDAYAKLFRDRVEQILNAL